MIKLKFNSKEKCIRFLKKPLELTKILEKKKRELEVKKGNINTSSAISYGIKSNSINKKVENSVIDVIELEEEIQNLEEKINVTKNLVNNFINKSEKLTYIEKRILIFRYIDFLSFEEIAYIEGYGIQNIYKNHKKNIKNIIEYS